MILQTEIDGKTWFYVTIGSWSSHNSMLFASKEEAKRWRKMWIGAGR
jgi:hypothetical protein